MNTNLKSILSLLIAGATAAFITACGSAGPQVVVVTATPTATPVVAQATPEATPIIKLTVRPETPVPTAIAFEAGTLLKGSGEEIFYVTEDGFRQKFHHQDTFLAYGFSEKKVITVDNETLTAIPLAGELTRLVADEADNLYWVAFGRRWRVNEWKQVGAAEEAGWLSVPWDSSLWQALPDQKGFKAGTLLRADNTTYYFDRGVVIPLTFKVDDQANVIDIPGQMLAAYTQKDQLEQTQARLNSNTPGANVRQNPSLQAQIIGTVDKNTEIIVEGRTADQAWLQIAYQGQFGWLAADLVEGNLTLGLLPVIHDVVAVADVPKAEPAAVVESSTPTPQPVYCPDVPIRGFGKVWGDYPEVKSTLGCPDSWQGGEQGTQAAVQLFQNGLMVWLQADDFYSGDPVWVFFSDGTYQRFGELGPADAAKVGTVPVGFYEVSDKFGKVYWEGTGAQVKERLGYAITPATDTAGAFQQFSNGRMFWTESLDRIFVVYEYGYFDENNTYIPVRTWHSYEDKF